MRVAIVSDTHMPRGGRRLPDRCVERLRSADAIVHCGDFVTGDIVRDLRSLGPPLHAVHGNVDTAEVRAVLPERTTVAFGGVRIGLVHDPGPARGRFERLRSSFPGCRAVLFGHTHMPQDEERDGFRIFNPGSPTERRRAPRHTMGIAEIDGDRLSLRLVPVA